VTDDLRLPAPPRAFFGFHQVRDASQTPRDIARAAWRFRDKSIPSDSIVFREMPPADDAKWGARVRERLARDLAELRFHAHGLVGDAPFPVPPIVHAPVAELIDRIAADPLSVAPIAIDARRHADGAAAVRSLEQSVLLPFLCGRFEAGERDRERELWSFGTEWERRLRNLVELRMQFQLALHSLWLDRGAFPLARIDEDGLAYRVGDDLVLAPVSGTADEMRRVVLPEGEWHHYWSMKRHAGGRPAEVPAQFGRPPLFVRAGAIVPSDPVRQHSAEALPHATFLDVFAADDMRGVLVERGADGATARTEFAAQLGYGALTLDIRPASGPWKPERLMWSVRVHGLGGDLRGARVDGVGVECGRGARTVEISFRATGERQVMEIEFDEY